ncbi:MAG: family 16 glycosylhydrolase [Bryobacteraceae bacterium]|jgi:uncharacterized protein (TIGR03437 family)
MKSLAIVACFLIAACALDGQTYQPRLNFGARLEPQGALIHGAGQSPETFAGYWGVMPAGRQPMVYMWYIGLAGLPANWSDQLKAQLLLYPNSFIIPQVGLNMTNGVTAAGVSESYDPQVAAGAYDQQIANLVTGLQRLATPVYLRIGYEFNGTGWNGYNPATYQQAYIRITNAIRAANLEVATVWDASGDAADLGVTDYIDYYPGDQYVDWFGMNMYGTSMFAQDPAITPFFALAIAHQKPIMLAEQSPRYVGAQGGATSWNGWFEQFFNFMQTTPVVKQFDYIDWDWSNYPDWANWGDARLETADAAYVRNQYVAQLAGPVMLNAGSETAFRKLLGVVNGTPPPAVTDLSAAVGPGGVVLTWTPVQDPSGIARYYIYRNGTLLNFWLGSGFVDSTATLGTAYSYTVAAMDRAGNLAAPSNAASVTVTSVERLLNGNFENGLTNWQSDSYAAGAVGNAVASTTNPIDGTTSAELTVSQSTGTAWHLQFLQDFNMTQGLTYTFSFKARASAPVSLPLMIQQVGGAYAVYLGPTAQLGVSANTFSYSFVAPASGLVAASFCFGDINPNTVWLDDVSVQESATSGMGVGGWQLVWSDEFNGAAGTAPNSANWDFDLAGGAWVGIAGGGWTDGEVETYTNSTNNAFQDGKGNLVIRAIKNAQGNYTSARLQTGAPGADTITSDLSWQYGLIAARIKLPFGRGVWPAFWMLGENYNLAAWPSSGEVDIMQNYGTYQNNASVNNAAAYGPGFTGGSGLTTAYTLPFGETVYDDYHVYAIQWSPNSIAWSLDGYVYKTVTPASLPAGSQWVFNNPFFLLLDLAIGGSSSSLGAPDSTVTFPQDMLVDYVRVYQTTTQPTTVIAKTPVITPGYVVNAASYLGTISAGGLASVFGANFAGGTYQGSQLLDSNGHFVTSVGSVSLSVNGVKAPLIYVSPTQINFQVPWETAPGLAVPVTVTWNSVTSSPEQVTIAATASPSFFISEFVNGTVWVTGAVANGCPTALSECSVKAGSTYQLWANGLGPKTSPLQDGVPAPLAALQVPGAPASCQLTVGGQPAAVWYCGVAPGEIIDQVNFTYPAGVSSSSPYVEAALTVNGVTGHFRVPAPAASSAGD